MLVFCLATPWKQAQTHNPHAHPQQPNRTKDEFVEEWRQSTPYRALHRQSPYVLMRTMLGLCVDAREGGNVARFVRRSCTPNAEVREYTLPGEESGKVCV